MDECSALSVERLAVLYRSSKNISFLQDDDEEDDKRKKKGRSVFIDDIADVDDEDEEEEVEVSVANGEKGIGRTWRDCIVRVKV